MQKLIRVMYLYNSLYFSTEFKHITKDWDYSDLAVPCLLESLVVPDVLVVQDLHVDLPQQEPVEPGNQDLRFLLWHLKKHNFYKAHYMQTDQAITVVYKTS